MKVQNPVVRGYAPDPSICRVGNDYYLVNSSCEYFPGVPIRHSRDLANWTVIGHCLTTPAQIPLANVKSSQGIYAPTIRYREGRFFMVTTNVGSGGNFLVHTNELEGPWSAPVFIKVDGIDPSLFWDEDGTCYLTTQSSEGVRQVVLDPFTGELKGESRIIWNGTGGQWPEGPHLFTRDGLYYLTIAEGGTEYGHMQTIARSTSPWGPFEPCRRNPILTHRSRSSTVHAVGHADFFEDAEGKWWLVCLGIRPNGYPPVHHIGRETFLCPVTWDAEGWPVVGENDMLPLEIDLPVTAVKSNAWRQDFRDELAKDWCYIRNPIPLSYSQIERPGYLILTGTPTSLGDIGAPTWIGQPQRDFSMRFETQLEPTVNYADEAGISIRMNEKHRYEFFANKSKILVRQTIGDLSYITASADIKPGKVLNLRVTSTAEAYSFEYGYDNEYFALGTAQTRYLGTEVAGGFTGVMLGLYAFSPSSSGYADFKWCSYTPIS